MKRRDILWTIRIDSRLLALATNVVPFLRSEHAPWTSTAQLAALAWRFAFNSDELLFARRLLAEKGNLWLFRSNQTRFCGDFVLIDMSSPQPARRPVYVLDLKRGAKLREGGGGASNQLANARRAVERLARRTGVIAGDAPYRLLTGDRAEILRYLGVAA